MNSSLRAAWGQSRGAWDFGARLYASTLSPTPRTVSITARDALHSLDAIGVITGRATTVQPVLQMTEDSYRFVSDISKARSYGYAPRVSLDAGLSQLVQHLGPHPTLPSGETILREGQQGRATVSRHL